MIDWKTMWHNLVQNRCQNSAGLADVSVGRFIRVNSQFFVSKLSINIECRN